MASAQGEIVLEQARRNREMWRQGYPMREIARDMENRRQRFIGFFIITAFNRGCGFAAAAVCRSSSARRGLAFAGSIHRIAWEPDRSPLTITLPISVKGGSEKYPLVPENGFYAQDLPDLVSKEKPRQQYADQHASGEVMRDYHHDDHRQHDWAAASGMIAEIPQRGPAEGTDRYHDHDGNQGRHWSACHPASGNHGQYSQASAVSMETEGTRSMTTGPLPGRCFLAAGLYQHVD